MTARSLITRATFDEDTFRLYMRLVRELHASHGLTELVANAQAGPLFHGYFNSVDAMVDAVAAIAGTADVNFGLNPRHASLLDTAPNEIRTLSRIPKAGDVAAITAVRVSVQVDGPGRRQSAARRDVNQVPLTRQERLDANELAQDLSREVSGGWVLQGNHVDLLVPVRATGDVRSWAWTHWRPFLHHLASVSRARAGSGVHVNVETYDPCCLVPAPGTGTSTGTESRRRRDHLVTFEPFGVPDVAANTATVEAHTCSGMGMQAHGAREIENVDIESITGPCPGHTALFTNSEGFPLLGAASEPAALAAILREAGYTTSSIVDLVVLHDRKNRGLLAGRYDAAFVIEQSIEGASVPRCMDVIETIGGHADLCLNCPMYRGPRGRFPLRPTGPAAASGMPLQLARELMSERLRDYLEAE